MMKVVPVVLTFAAMSIGLADQSVAQEKKADTADILQELQEWQHRQMLRFDKWMETEGKKKIPDADQSQQSTPPQPPPAPSPTPSIIRSLPKGDFPPYYGRTGDFPPYLSPRQ